jgi:tetrapyrrole methylase family protein / MazG family protein
MPARRPSFDDLVAIMARLRGPGGCPWDREQTHQTLRPYLVEETYEALEAIDAGAPDQLRQELGDLLLQVVFHAQMAAEAGAFDIDDVIAGLVEKLVRRHPHVFGDIRVTGSGDVLTNWEAIKERERTDGLHGTVAHPASGGTLRELPRALPALMLAQRIQELAARAGLACPDFPAALGKVAEELAELRAAAEEGNTEQAARELGDLLFAVANLPRYLGLDGEQALRGASAIFRERFAHLEESARSRGRTLSECTPEELAQWWRAAR